jgi:hypothetical protein
MKSVMRSTLFRLTALSFFGLAASCAYYNEKNPGDPSTITAQTVSWQRVSAEFFGPRCAICHGQGGANVNVSDYNSVLQNISRIQQDVLVRQKMPPDSPLTAYEQKLLSTWIDSGTPYTATGNGG